MAVWGHCTTVQPVHNSHCWGHRLHVLQLCLPHAAGSPAGACLKCGVAASEGLPMNQVEGHLRVVVTNLCLLLALL